MLPKPQDLDEVVADHANFLLRWFQLGAAMTPAELRARVVTLEQSLGDVPGALASDDLEPSGRVLYLPGHEPEPGEYDGTR